MRKELKLSLTNRDAFDKVIIGELDNIGVDLQDITGSVVKRLLYDLLLQKSFLATGQTLLSPRIVPKQEPLPAPQQIKPALIKKHLPRTLEKSAYADDNDKTTVKTENMTACIDALLDSDSRLNDKLKKLSLL